jgi:hypothetical protein
LALSPIMLTRPPNEVMLDDSYWDELLEGGIHEVCVSWLAFLKLSEDGVALPSHEEVRPRVLSYFSGVGSRFQYVPIIQPDESLYRGLPFRPPARPDEFAPLAKELNRAFEKAKAKGITLYLFDDKGYFENAGYLANPDGTRGFLCWNNPQVAEYTVARTRDYAQQLPDFSGIVLDGPDNKWEIAPGVRDDLFEKFCTCEHCYEAARSMGLDYAKLLDGLVAFRSELQDLTDEKVRGFLLSTRGLLGAVDWWMSHPELLDLMRFRYATIERHLKREYDGIKKHLPDFTVMASSRLPAFTALTGHSLKRRNEYTDYQLCKLYLWPGNQPGFRYTVSNYVRTFQEWNPGLSRDSAVALTERILGIEFPSDYPVERFDEPAPASFYDQVAGDEMKKMVHLVGDADRLIPFVALEHFGGPQIDPDEVRHLLRAMEANGIKRYIFYHYGVVSDDIWRVMGEFSKSP